MKVVASARTRGKDLLTTLYSHAFLPFVFLPCLFLPFLFLPFLFLILSY